MIYNKMKLNRKLYQMKMIKCCNVPDIYVPDINVPDIMRCCVKCFS